MVWLNDTSPQKWAIANHTSDTSIVIPIDLIRPHFLMRIRSRGKAR
jgi:hypothetical protein